jgi:hypothetical protein
MDHLEDVLSNLPVEVSAGSTIVEIKPQGVSKGTAVEAILERAALVPSAAAAAGEAPGGAAATGEGAAAAAAAAEAAGARRVRFAEAPQLSEFVCCIGNDRSDEDMFIAVEAHAAARQDRCKVGRAGGAPGAPAGALLRRGRALCPLETQGAPAWMPPRAQAPVRLPSTSSRAHRPSLRTR